MRGIGGGRWVGRGRRALGAGDDAAGFLPAHTAGVAQSLWPLWTCAPQWGLSGVAMNAAHIWADSGSHGKSEDAGLETVGIAENE